MIAKINNISMVVWNEFTNDARVLKEAQTLQHNGYHVTVHALHTPRVTQETEILADGIKVIRIARSPLWKWRKTKASAIATAKTVNKHTTVSIGKISLWGQVLRIIARLWTHLWLIISMVKAKPNIIHAHDVNTLPTAWMAAVLTRSPLVYDAHEISTSREGYKHFRRLVAWLEKLIMPRVAATITTTETRAQFFTRAYKIDKPVVLQNRPRYTQVASNNKIRQELQLQQDWPIVLYQGGLQQGRGLDKLIAAAKQVQAYFVFIGGGRLASSLKQQVIDMDLSDKVFFIDTLSLQDLPIYTASADIGVQPIENTCFNHFSTDSNKLFEYVMAGLPVVASKLPEIKLLITRYNFGELSIPGDTSSLAAAINKLVIDKTLRRTYSNNSAIAAKNLSWEEQEAQLIELYHNI